jgi:hypothetical protein
VALDGERILPYEQVFMSGKAHHSIARTVADETRVRRDPHDCGIQMSARLAVPARLEGRIKREPMVCDLDRANAVHGRRHCYLLFAGTHWHAVHIVLNSVNLSIVWSLEAMLEFLVLAALQAFTLTPSIKAEKLNSAIEKKH